MYKNKKIIAVIPARGGSKGLPGKNIRQIAGKPLIAWSIKAAQESRYVDKLIVSTDSQEIADVATSWGADVPFIRPAELASDEAKSIDVILHALNIMQSPTPRFSLVLLLQPTSPLRTGKDIDNAVELLFEKNAKSIVSVCKAEHHPWWTNTLPENGGMKDFLRTEICNTNRQQLPIYYRLNGAIYLAEICFIEKVKSFITEGTFAHLMRQEYSIDIDTLIDFRLAEIYLMDRKKAINIAITET
ncbi:acylneuraminate cytidylyltransferase family protein [uncultured Desulfobulbus sp.]|uniref:acylneuraminate cytidylyltransferase family protein n=1 Tax=uncultured Desulfobulbus sp. TaxID=239745 RepID=UPI0029C77B38|nr:acylneuraminate cytidylyltransferase family protein [uncultured Desulfobulbus sp.]